MNQNAHTSHNNSRALGLRVRGETLSILKGRVVHDALKVAYAGEAAVELSSLVPSWLETRKIDSFE